MSEMADSEPELISPGGDLILVGSDGGYIHINSLYLDQRTAGLQIYVQGPFSEVQEVARTTSVESGELELPAGNFEGFVTVAKYNRPW